MNNIEAFTVSNDGTSVEFDLPENCTAERAIQYVIECGNDTEGSNEDFHLVESYQQWPPNRYQNEYKVSGTYVAHGRVATMSVLIIEYLDY